MTRSLWVAAMAAMAVAFNPGICLAQTTRPAVNICPVAVIDLQQVVKDLGKDAELQGLIERAKEALTVRGKAAAEPDNTKMADLQTRIQDRVKRIAMTRPEAEGNVAILQRDLEWVSIYKEIVDTQEKLKALDQKYNQALQTYAQNLLRAWQDTLQPAMITVAKEKGILLILPKNPQVIGNSAAVQIVAWSAPQLDLTGDVVQYLKMNPPKPFTPPPSKFDIPK